jgi:hypothetical protein
MKSIDNACRHSSPAGLIMRQKEPTNLEMPFGQCGPYEHDWNYGSYVITHRLPIDVMVEDRARNRALLSVPADCSMIIKHISSARFAQSCSSRWRWR